MLATITTDAPAQSVYLESIGSLASTPIGAGTYVVAGGYNNPGDGGGGVFMPTGGTSCTPDNGIVFRDGTTPTGNCFVRADPTYSVREWGALCDVAEVVDTQGNVTWANGTDGNGTLTVPTAMLSAPPVVATQPAKFIAISQIGQPTLWANSGSAMPAVSLTRFSTVGGSAQTGYSVNDLVSFAGGTFSQQAAIIVDDVHNGTITQWHFLWGGIYDPSVESIGTLQQDNAHTTCAAVTPATCTGAVLTPAWSGWSVLNEQTISNAGSNYSVGQVVTLSGAGAVANQAHLPKLKVEATISGGGVAAFDWVDYGSLKTLPTDPTTLTDTAPSIPGNALTLHALR